MQAAAEDGDIQILRHADREVLVVLFLVYSRHRTIRPEPVKQAAVE